MIYFLKPEYWDDLRARLQHRFGKDGAELIEEFIVALLDDRDWEDPDDDK